MQPEFGFTEKQFNTSYAPLCVLGEMVWQQEQLSELRNSELKGIKTHKHKPGEKLLDAFLVILSGYPSLSMLNTKLRTDPMLSQAWHRDNFADQSGVSRTLDGLYGKDLEQIREVGVNFWKKHSRIGSHDWRKQLTLDLDLTALKASRHAEESKKGYFDKKTLQDDNCLV